jgi:DNA-binding CsgD family transcriptional regulator
MDGEPVGRANEKSVLERAISDVGQGAKRGLVFIGEPGSGKSTLLHWAFGHARRSEITCVLARAPAVGALSPRFPLPELQTAILRELGRARQGSSIAPAGGDSPLRSDSPVPQGPELGILSGFRKVSELGPTAVLLDDVHWASTEALALLLTVLGQLDGPILFVATSRAVPREVATPLLPQTTSDLPIDRFEIAGLNLDSVAELATRTLAGPVLPSLSQELHDRTLGNPLYVLELLRAWRQAGEIEALSGGYWGFTDSGSRPYARSLLEMIAHRLRGLDSSAMRVASAFAILGREAPPRELRAILGLKAADLLEALNDLDDAGIINREMVDGKYRLTHPLFQAALLAQLSNTKRAALHGEVYSALEQARTSSGAEVAYHAVRTLEPPEDIAELVRAAAVEAEQLGSYAEAADWYERLAGIVRDAHSKGAALAGQAAAIEHFDPELASRIYGKAIALTPAGRPRVRLILGRARTQRMAGRPQEALEALDEAAALASGLDLLEIRDTSAVIQAALGNTELAAGQFERLVKDSEGTPIHATALGHLSMVAYYRGELEMAVELGEIARSECLDLGHCRYLDMNRSWFLCLLGRWEEAERLLHKASKAAERSNDLWLLAPMMTTSAVLAAWRGDFNNALDVSARAVRMTSTSFLMDHLNALGVFGLALLEKGDAKAAVELLTPVPALLQNSSETSEVHQSLAVLAEGLLIIGDIRGARRVSDLGRVYVARNLSYQSSADRLDAQILLAEGDLDGAFGILEGWHRQPSRVRFEQGRIHEVLSEAHLKAGSRMDALEESRRAHQIFESLGAKERARKVSDWLVAHLPKKPGRPKVRVAGNLTHREAEILRLVVQGKTNTEIATVLFISPGTVKKHVDNIKSKFLVRKRSELIASAVAASIQHDVGS